MQATDFFHAENFVLGAEGCRQVGIPEKAQLRRHGRRPGDRPLDEDWTAGGNDISPRVAGRRSTLPQLKADPAHLKPTLIYEPSPREAFDDAAASKDMLLVSILDNVRGRTSFTPGPKGSWTHGQLDLPDNSTCRDRGREQPTTRRS